MKVLLGGYTTKTSKGIYAGKIDTSTSPIEIEQVKNVINVNRPTYFQIDGDLLITIIQDGVQAGIASYKKDKDTYTQVDTFFHPGAAPAYVGLDRTHHLIFTANYHLATLNVFSYDDGGHITFITNTQHQGSGPRPEQEAAHPHYFDRTPKGHLVSCDLGTDRVDFYDFKDNKLVHLATYQMESGFGTRHLTFSPDGKTMFIVGELSSQVNVAHINEENWTFENIATYKTIPDHFEGHNGAAAIRLSKDGNFLYVSNRGDDSIAVFKVKPDSQLELIQRISTFGAFPRDFNWDKAQKLVVAANQNTNNATLYTRNEKNGTLTPIQKNILAPEATCVQFIQ
ncbi:lactonase family protein [Lactobacillus sp. PV034]|uniref:lactonase family protein n=1 Tax=Lactobacillus sp. PV034 TaxID=2594495 RepID=UPI0022401C7F|nr:lactonase family protein [Lactobacillus sp. PV034]QNQ80740.1 lactonase family protein [Lactobacillus sp. PV034]